MTIHSVANRDTSASRRLSIVRTVPVGEKRDLILRAATKVFAQNGYFQSQVADVARVAGVAAGTVYLYFKGKDDLLVSIFERSMNDVLAEARAAIDGVADPASRLQKIARLHLERLGRDKDLAVVFQVELRQSVKFMERFSETFLQDYFKLIRTAIADGQHGGAFRKDISATTATKIFFGALDEMATNWVLSRRKYDLRAEADAVVDLFINGVQRR
jgi:TetR/AcrR family fatty acid metabolism transcriptional regulator